MTQLGPRRAPTAGVRRQVGHLLRPPWMARSRKQGTLCDAGLASSSEVIVAQAQVDDAVTARGPPRGVLAVQ